MSLVTITEHLYDLIYHSHWRSITSLITSYEPESWKLRRIISEGQTNLSRSAKMKYRASSQNDDHWEGVCGHEAADELSVLGQDFPHLLYRKPELVWRNETQRNETRQLWIRRPSPVDCGYARTHKTPTQIAAQVGYTTILSFFSHWMVPETLEPNYNVSPWASNGKPRRLVSQFWRWWLLPEILDKMEISASIPCYGQRYYDGTKQMTNDKKIHFSLEVSLYGQVKRETSVTTVISYTMALIDQFNTRPLHSNYPSRQL